MRILIKALIFLFKEIENVIFPQCCLMCGKFVSDIWCKDCKAKLYEKSVFKIDNCNNKDYYFDKHIYLFVYRDIIRKLIIDYKFNDKSYLYKMFSEIIIKNEKICGILKKYDIIIPVPIHNIRKRQRGYNQCELIAKAIADKIKYFDCENKVVMKIKNTLPQSCLSKEQRKENVQDVYKIINKDKIKNKKIIIFDDVYTTGNTVNSIAKILKDNEAKEVLILTIAKD